MKKLASVIFLTMAIGASARQISPGEAMTLASDFMNNGELQSVTPSSKMLRPMRAPGADDNASVSPYYVFNRGEKDGFVIISGDDRAPKILGYSDKGSFDAENLPPQLKAMMEQWASQMAQLPTSAPQHASWSKIASTRAGEGVLMETAEWGQNAPFNNLCPTVEGQKAPAGCVATAMAIAMKYHNWPDATRGGKESDYYMKSETFDFDKYSIDWNALSDKEDPKFAEEAAKLTYSAGVAAQMSYGAYESTAMSWTLSHLFQYFYAYDKDCQVLPREKFNDSEWNSMLMEQLEKVGPVVYFGNGAGGEYGKYGADGDESPVGHCFVVDGYDTEGLYHVNWGWDGISNGYFTLDFAVDGRKFNNYQGMVINLKPDKEKNIYSRVWIPNLEVYIGGEVNDWNFLYPDVAVGQPNKFKTPTLCISGFQGYVGVAIVNEDDNIVKLIDGSAKSISGERISCSMPGSPFFGYEDLVLPELNEGERYQLVSQEVTNQNAGEAAEGPDETAESYSTDPKDWNLVLGGMIHPSYFYATGNPSNISEVRVHIPENLPSYSQSLNSYDKEFTLRELIGMACPVSFYFPTKNIKYELTCTNNDGEAVEPVYITWDYKDNETFIGFNISTYAKEYDLTFIREDDGDTRRDSEYPSEQVVENDGLVYKKLANGLELIGYDKIGETITIPDSVSVDGKKWPVISLADMSLAYAPVKHVEILPDSLLIGKFVLAGTDQLEDVTIKNLSISLGDTPHPDSRFMFAQSGLKNVYFDEAPKDDNLFYVLTGHQYEYLMDKDEWGSASTGTDVDFVVSVAPSNGEDVDYLIGLEYFLRSTPAKNKNSSFKSYIIPGLGNTAVLNKKNDIEFNVREMWKYDIKKLNNQVRLDSILPNVEIESVLINGENATIGSDGYYTMTSGSTTRAEVHKDLDVVVNYLVNGVKKSTHYSPEYNKSIDTGETAVEVKSIQLSPESWSGSKGESFSITATILPENATDKTVNWSSSDESVATVDSEGNVIAIKPGTALITATAADGSGIAASCVVSVMNKMGDSNGDGIINVSDAVNAANYIVGLTTTNFDFDCADMNSDGDITVSDVTLIISLIPAQTYGNESDNNRNQAKAVPSGYLVSSVSDVDGSVDFSVVSDENLTALQFDLRYAAGERMPEIKLGDAFASSHILQQFNLDANTVRIVVYSISGKPLTNAGQNTVVTLSGVTSTEDLVVNNIFASNVCGASLGLEFQDLGESNAVSGSSVASLEVKVAGGRLVVSNATGNKVSVYALDGRCIGAYAVDTDRFELNLSSGIYIVAVGNSSQRVIIK